MTTLKDISKATSLSLSTVSAVLGGRAEKLAISKKTIEKVLACAEELDYHRIFPQGLYAAVKVRSSDY